MIQNRYVSERDGTKTKTIFGAVLGFIEEWLFCCTFMFYAQIVLWRIVCLLDWWCICALASSSVALSRTMQTRQKHGPVHGFHNTMYIIVTIYFTFERKNMYFNGHCSVCYYQQMQIVTELTYFYCFHRFFVDPKKYFSKIEIRLFTI